nr:transglutaminase-like cysteine peptidase [Motiliproteus sp. SC1-56]
MLALALALPIWGAAVGVNGLPWDEVLERVADKYGERARLRVNSWRRLMEEGAALSEPEKLEQVNRFFNQLIFIDDLKLWRETDYWATPLEFLGANGGDCEDYSIAKYLTLLALGVDQEKLRITYVKATRLDQHHMVVAYYRTPDAMPVILDNLEGEILPASERGDLVPIYSFNGQNLWLNKERGRGVLAGKASRLQRWNDLRSRYRIQSLRVPELSLE